MMKEYFTITVLLMFSLFLSEFSFANPANPSNNNSQPDSQTAIKTVKVKEMKDMISKLIRQDGYLDETIELIEESNNKLTIEDIEAMSLTMKLIRNNLEHVLFLAKKQFSEVQPFQGLSKYTKTILSYTSKLDKKISFLNRTILKSINKTSGAKAPWSKQRQKMRDALSSKKNPKFQGKKLTLILEEEKGMQKLSEYIKQLKSSSRKLNATSKWLYVVSK